MPPGQPSERIERVGAQIAKMRQFAWALSPEREQAAACCRRRACSARCFCLAVTNWYTKMRVPIDATTSRIAAPKMYARMRRHVWQQQHRMVIAGPPGAEQEGGGKVSHQRCGRCGRRKTKEAYPDAFAPLWAEWVARGGSFQPRWWPARYDDGLRAIAGRPRPTTSYGDIRPG